MRINISNIANLPSQFGTFKVQAFQEGVKEHLVIFNEPFGEIPLVRIHRQEGRNIGLLNKVNAYALQDQGLDTIEANHQLGFKTDERSYEVVEFILDHFRINQIRLLTNNPLKIKSLKGIAIVDRWPIVIPSNKHNKSYLKTKKELMGHML